MTGLLSYMIPPVKFWYSGPKDRRFKNIQSAHGEKVLIEINGIGCNYFKNSTNLIEIGLISILSYDCLYSINKLFNTKANKALNLAQKYIYLFVYFEKYFISKGQSKGTETSASYQKIFLCIWLNWQDFLQNFINLPMVLKVSVYKLVWKNRVDFVLSVEDTK